MADTEFTQRENDLFHEVAKLEKGLNAAKRIALPARNLALDAQHALANGRLEIVQEFLERIVDDLTKIRSL